VSRGDEPSWLLLGGVAQALNAAHRGGKVRLTSLNASRALLSALQNGTADALLVEYPGKKGYDSAKAMEVEIRKGVKATNEDTGVTLVTKANFYDSAIQGLPNPSCAKAPI
jgi:ribose transport system substrate-binding protein